MTKRPKVTHTAHDEPDEVFVEDPVLATKPAKPLTDNPAADDVPLQLGKGGRYTMENGRRVKRTD